MKLCVLANLYGNKTLDDTLARLSSLGVEAVEIGLACARVYEYRYEVGKTRI